MVPDCGCRVLFWAPSFAGMARSRRFWIGLMAGGVLLGGLVLWRAGIFEQEPERWFRPGPLGHERGHRLPPPTARAFLTRAMSGVDRMDEGEWSRRNELTNSLSFSHALAQVFPPELSKTHPEFFPLVDGRRLQPPANGPAFWNPDLGREDVANYAAGTARSYFEAHPNAESFGLGVNDALIFGESPENLALIAPAKWFRERPDYSPLVFTFMNRAAQNLARTHPTKYLGALAYYFAENTPPFPVHPQVVPFLTADRAQGYDAKFSDEEFQLQARWASSGVKRLGMYDYLFGNGFLIPRIHTRLLAENLQHARRVGFTDYYAEVNPNWGLDGPMPWLAAQLLRDPDQSRERLLDEYYRRYFKETAGPMRRFFEACEARWMGQPGPSYWLKHFRNDSQAAIFPTEVCRELRLTLGEAARLAATDLVRERVRGVSAAFGVTERFVAFEEARAQVSRQILSGADEWRPLASGLQAYLFARREFIRSGEALKREQPLALAPFGWDDYLKNDPVPAALLAIRQRAGSKGEGAEAEAEIATWRDTIVMALWPATQAFKAEKVIERNGWLAGPLQPARKIAGLDYGVSLPPEWTSKVEPAQFFRADLLEAGPGRALRIVGSKDTMIFQWDAMSAPGLHRGSIVLTGRVAPGAIVSVMLGWLDQRERNVGFKSFRLPDGDWSSPVTLEIAGLAPANAVWVGVGLRIQNQVGGDWVEVKDFRLRAN